MSKRPYVEFSSSPASKRQRLPEPSWISSSQQKSKFVPPPSYVSTDEWQKVTEGIESYCQRYHQNPDLYRRKQLLRDALFAVTKDILPLCGLYIVGSSLSGFGSNKSDMDLCLMVSPSEIDQKQEATQLLFMLLKAFRRLSFLKDVQLIRAKVPILKFVDTKSSIECDLNINNSVGIRNTHLLNAYSQLDTRVAPLVLFVKYWAKSQNINDASKGTISSYSLSLMVLHFLQCGCHPPALPSLQLMYPDVFNASQDIRLISLDKKLPVYTSRNHESLGELFYGFLNYFANTFKFQSDAISVRLGEKMTKGKAMYQNTRRNPTSQWKYICIEEPFDLSNTARSVFDENTFQKIFHVIRRSWETLRKTHNVDAIINEPV